MVIFTQNYDLVDFEKFCKVGAYELNLSDREACAVVGMTDFNELPNDTSVILGIYDTREQCEVVISDLAQAFDEDKRVYEMPGSVDVLPQDEPPYNDETAEAE